MNKVFYRYESKTEEIIKPFLKTTLILIEYGLVKETEKGYWISQGNVLGFSCPKIWISKNSKKRFAYPTKEEALNYFIKRKEFRQKILEYQLESCVDAIYEANKLMEELNKSLTLS